MADDGYFPYLSFGMSQLSKMLGYTESAKDEAGFSRSTSWLARIRSRIGRAPRARRRSYLRRLLHQSTPSHSIGH
jgi:hypothetical protein